MCLEKIFEIALDGGVRASHPTHKHKTKERMRFFLRYGNSIVSRLYFFLSPVPEGKIRVMYKNLRELVSFSISRLMLI